MHNHLFAVPFPVCFPIMVLSRSQVIRVMGSVLFHTTQSGLSVFIMNITDISPTRLHLFPRVESHRDGTAAIVQLSCLDITTSNVCPTLCSPRDILPQPMRLQNPAEKNYIYYLI